MKELGEDEDEDLSANGDRAAGQNPPAAHVTRKQPGTLAALLYDSSSDENSSNEEEGNNDAHTRATKEVCRYK